MHLDHLVLPALTCIYVHMSKCRTHLYIGEISACANIDAVFYSERCATSWKRAMKENNCCVLFIRGRWGDRHRFDDIEIFLRTKRQGGINIGACDKAGSMIIANSTTVVPLKCSLRANRFYICMTVNDNVCKSKLARLWHYNA